MTLDVANAAFHTDGERHSLGPFWAEGVFVEPPVQTRSSQVTGAGATVLRAAYTGGVIKILGKAVTIAGAEATLASADNYLISGQAVWFSLVAVQHRNTGSVSLVWVRGTIAAVASAVVATLAEIVAFLGLGEDQMVFVLGDIRFHRSADTTIVHQASDLRRPLYIDEDGKTGLIYDETDQSNMGEVEGAVLDLPLHMVQVSAAGVGTLIVDGAALPNWPFGGRITRMEYIPAQDATGAGATQQLVLGIDGTPCTGTLTLTLANAVIPTPVAATVSAANRFRAGQGLDVEAEDEGTAFTAGTGILRITLKKYVRR